MKLRYKRIVLIITMSTMCIGFVTLTAWRPSEKHARNADQPKASSTASAKPVQEDLIETQAPNVDTQAKENAEKDLDTLQRDAYPEINQLVKDYIDASVACDMEKLSKLVSKTNNLQLSSLQEKAKYIEGYENIECYTLPGLEEKSYVVYVYEEAKFRGADTLAPGMIRLYVRTSKEGKPYIHLGNVDEKTLNFIDETYNNEDVQRIVDTVNKKCEEAKTKDPQLKKIIEKIETSQEETSKKDKK